MEHIVLSDFANSGRRFACAFTGKSRLASFATAWLSAMQAHPGNCRAWRLLNVCLASLLAASLAVASADPASAQSTVEPAKLVISVAPTGSVQRGAVITYRVTVTNTGGSASFAVEWVASSTSGTTFRSLGAPPGWTCTTPQLFAHGPSKCSAQTLTNGASADFVLTVDSFSASNPASTTFDLWQESMFGTLSKVDTETITTQVIDPTVAITAPAAGALPGAMAGAAYNQSFTARGGTGPHSFALAAGSTLPAGLTLGPEGTLSGTPTASGNFAFSVIATDTTPAPAGPYSSTPVAYTLAVAPPQADVAIEVMAPSSVVRGDPITYTVTVTNLGPAAAGHVNWNTGSPNGETFRSLAPAPGWACSTPTPGSTGPTSCDTSSLAVGETARFTFVIETSTAPQVVSPFFGVATLNADPDAGNNVATVATFVIDPIVAITAPAAGALPSAMAGAAYNQSFTASGGAGPHSFALAAGSTLPAGLTLGPEGTLSGTPTASGNFAFSVIATDATPAPAGPYASTPVAYTLTVSAPTITLAPASLPDGWIGIAYSETLHASGGVAPYSYSLAAGNVPPGLALAAASGIISGTPTAQGSYSFTVRAIDSATGLGAPFEGHATYTIVVGARVLPPVANPVAATVAFGSTDNPITPDFADSGGTPISIAIADQPGHGSATVSGGSIRYTPASGHAGTDVFTYTGTNATGTSDPATVTVTVETPNLTVTPDGALVAQAGSAYSRTFTFDGGTSPYVDAGVTGLPAGLSVTAATGDSVTISGTPTVSGTFTLTVSATDSSTGDGPFTASETFTLALDAPDIAVLPARLPSITGGIGIASPVTANGGTAPYAFTITEGALPEGLNFNPDGSFEGVAEEAGSFMFTVTATDDNGFSGSRSYTLDISHPRITVSVPDLPVGKVNSAYTPISLSATGGTDPYVFGLASGNLPEGMMLVSDGTLSGTPAEAGQFTVTISATDAYGFEGTADTTLTIEALTLPEARNHTLEVMAGTSGMLDLTLGATGGPFTGAAIATHPAGEAGEARIVREDSGHMLHFAAAGSFAGAASLTYTLSNADGTSAPAAVTITVIARPDPSLDPEVIGLIRAQTETARRFANTQITNFNQRLEQLHNEGERRTNSISVNVAVQQTQNNNEHAYAPDEETAHDPAVGAINQAAPVAGNDTGSEREAASPVENLFGEIAFWSGGFVNFGTNDNGTINLDHTLVGVSGGVDYRFTPQFTAGIGVGYGRDVTEIGSNGTDSRTEAFSFATYGSYRPLRGFFLDGLAGYSTMSFDSRRYVTASGDVAIGSRGGDQLFASVSAGYEYRDNGLLISPYGRLSGSHSTLDAFTEAGAGMWNLTYSEQTIHTLSGTLGLRFEYAIPTTWGVLTPRGRLEYTHDFEGWSRAGLGYADLGTLPYGLDIEGFSRDHLTVALGFDAQISESWNFGFDYRTALDPEGDSQDHTFALKLGLRF